MLYQTSYLRKSMAFSTSSAFLGAYMGAFCGFGECPREYTRIGIGAQYAHLRESHTKQTHSDIYAGYLSVEGGIATTNNRTQFVLSAKLGASKQNPSLVSPQFVREGVGVFGEARTKAGVNLATKNIPLYLNLAYTFEAYTSRKKGGLGYSYLFHYLGGELDGAIPLGKRVALQYSVGYDWLFYGGYGFGKDSSLSPFSLKGEAYSASVGASYFSSERMEYYLKIIFRYQNLGASKISNEGFGMPALANSIGMLEMGVGF